VVATKVCQGEIFEPYEDKNTRFRSNAFVGYKALLAYTHNSMIMYWMLDLNFGMEHLAFDVNQQHI
jgi:hypothetical protein